MIGYSICEVIDTPEWLHGIGKQVLSVCGCIGEQHPGWECFMGGWCKGESQAYQNALRMNGEQYKEFSDADNQLFNWKRLDADGRKIVRTDKNTKPAA